MESQNLIMNASNTDLAREQLIFTNFAYSQLVLCAIIYLILPFEVAGFIEFMYRSDRRDNVNRFYLRIGLFAGQITGAITVSVVLALAMHDQFDQSLCEDIAKFTFTMYIACTCISYMFLLQKAKLVSRFEQANKFHKNMFMVVQWGICVMIVGGLVLGGALTHGRLTHGGHCMEVIPSQLVWFILVCNTFMCIALVYLFLQPLRKVAMPGNRNSVNDMAFVFKKNAFISSGAVIGTFIIATTYSVFVQLGESTGVDEYYTIGLSIMVWDVLILCVASRLTTNMWLPRYMTRILRIQNKSQVSETRTTRNDNRASVACFERSRSVAPKRFDQPVETLVQISNIKE